MQEPRKVLTSGTNVRRLINRAIKGGFCEKETNGTREKKMKTLLSRQSYYYVLKLLVNE